MSPLPEEIYPPEGWSCREAREERVSFARDGDRVVVAADRTTDSPQPSLDCPYAWVLTYRQRTGVAIMGGSVGFVTTKDAAIEGLFTCMRQVNAALDRSGIDIDLHTVLDRINLRDEIPSAGSDE